MPAPSSIPQSDIDSNLDDRSSTVRALQRNNDLSEDIAEHLSMSVFIPPDPMPQEFPQSTHKQYRSIIANLGPTPSATSEEKQSVREQTIDDPMSPLSPCTETSTHASPARSTISLQASSIAVSHSRHLMFYWLTFICFLLRILHPSGVINPSLRKFPPIYDIVDMMNHRSTRHSHCLLQVGSTYLTFAEKTNYFAW